MEQWVFWPTAFVSLGSALYMVTRRNTVHSALTLVVNFFTLAVFYVLLDAHFLAAAQIIVYAGAIMVLFLFVIMLLGVDVEEDLRDRLRFQLPVALFLSGVLAAILVLTVRLAFDRSTFAGLKDANHAGNVQGLGRLLFTSYLFPFEVTSLLLIVAAVAAMVIGKRRPLDERDPEDEDA